MEQPALKKPRIMGEKTAQTLPTSPMKKESPYKRKTRIIACNNEKYQILDTLGVGGYGSVYKVKSLTNDKEYAVKVMKYKTESRKKRLDREIRILRALSKTCNVNKRARWICFIKSCETSDSVYLFTPMINGSNLSVWLSNNANASLQKRLTIIYRLIKILSNLHKLGYTHRDLKPSNIQIDNRGNVILLDFGLACQTSDQECNEPIFEGTPKYLDPQSWIATKPNKFQDNIKKDIWAIGIVFYQILSGIAVIKDKHDNILNAAFGRKQLHKEAFQIVRSFVTNTLLNASQVPTKDGLYLPKFVQKCMEIDPSKRFSSMSHCLKYACKELKLLKLLSEIGKYRSNTPIQNLPIINNIVGMYPNITDKKLSVQKYINLLDFKDFDKLKLEILNTMNGFTFNKIKDVDSQELCRYF